jgi:hypothetical protein
VSLIALALLRISRISSVLKACVSRRRVFFGTGTEQSTNGLLAINRCLTAPVQTALSAVTQMFITVNAARFFVTSTPPPRFVIGQSVDIPPGRVCIQCGEHDTPAADSARREIRGGNISLEQLHGRLA